MSEIFSLVDLLSERAARQPETRAYTFLIDGEREGNQFTYQDLDGKARAIGALLQQCADHGDRALMLYPPGLEFVAAFFGCLYGGIIAVPAYPPDPVRLQRSLSRLFAIIKDAQPKVVLTVSAILEKTNDLIAQFPNLAAMRWIDTENIDAELSQQWKNPAVNGDTLAFLQYTSGSTSTPKGVMISHENLLQNNRSMQHAFESSPASISATWLPSFHDMGLVEGILHPLYVGFPSYIMSPISFLQRPLRWLQTISRYKVTISGSPNFGYELCVHKTTPEQRLTLDLSSWFAAYNGAEPVRNETKERFIEAFRPAGFSPSSFWTCYGLAEATLKVSGGPKRDLPSIPFKVQKKAFEQNQIVAAPAAEKDFKTLISSGKPILNTRVVIVDPETMVQCPPDQIGEILVMSPSVARGYWNQPDETKRTLQARLSDTNEGPFLRTGDLGFLKDGELFITGRIKDLIIIDGANHYPQDIELTVEKSHSSIRPGCCAAFSINADEKELLVVVAEVESKKKDADRSMESAHQLDAKEIIKAIRRAVSEDHGIQVDTALLLKPGTIPKTSSGKIQRSSCRLNFQAGSLEVYGE